MRTRRAIVLLPLAAVAVSACPAPYSAPVSVPTHLGAAEMVDCHAFTPSVWDGGGAPKHATKVTARCADPAVCTAFVENGEVVVWGNHPSATEVLVTYEHPTTGEHGEAKIALSFDAPTRGDWLHPRVTDPTHCRRDHTRPKTPATPDAP